MIIIIIVIVILMPKEKHQSLVGAIETLQTEISELQKDEAVRK